MLLQIRKPVTTFAAPCRHRRVGDHIVVTSIDGSYAILAPREFESFVEGTVARGSDLWRRLDGAHLIRETFDPSRVAERLRRRREFLAYGPNLHVLVVTLRCNTTCVYCHASRAPMDARETDMSPAVASKCIDLALASTSPGITIEFQGGEPLANFDVVKHAIEYAIAANRAAGKALGFTLVSNLSLMDDEKLAFLVDHKVQICTSIDGPAQLHDHQRKLAGGGGFASAARWIERINHAYEARGMDAMLYHVEALLTTTRETLPRWREVVDTYRSLGCRAIFLRPLDPFGFAERTSARLEYPRDEFLAFYRSAVDYMLELNGRGEQILERFAAIFLAKILDGRDPNYLDIRNPCGAGIGQIAYNYDGSIFTCDEGRMLHAMGDETFRIGHVETSRYREITGHATVRAMALASNLDAQPDCVQCAWQPYCGVCPVHSHRTQGTLFGRMRESSLCAVHKGIQDYLFEKIAANDPATMDSLRKWTTVRERPGFVHPAR